MTEMINDIFLLKHWPLFSVSVYGPLPYVLNTAEVANVVSRHHDMVSRCTSMPTTFRFTLTMPHLQSPRVWPISRSGWELRLIPIKSRLCLPVAKLDITHVRVLSSCLRVQDTAMSSTASCTRRLTSVQSVEVATTSCVSYGRLSGHCLKMRVRH